MARVLGGTVAAPAVFIVGLLLLVAQPAVLLVHAFSSIIITTLPPTRSSAPSSSAQRQEQQPASSLIVRAVSLNSNDHDGGSTGSNDNNNNNVGTRPVMSESIPFLKWPEPLSLPTTMMMAGNVGFDPLGVCRNDADVQSYREAEIRHARLAMLAAVGWPLSELYDRQIAAYFDLPTILDAKDRVPAVLNGGLEQISPVFWGFCFGLSMAIEQYAIAKSREGSPDYFPGNLGFDPLNFYPSNDNIAGQYRMQLAEIKHGRLAMMAVLGYVVQEYVTSLGVIDETPFFFINPFI